MSITPSGYNKKLGKRALKMSVGDFLIIYKCVDSSLIDELAEIVRKPYIIAGNKTPDDLNNITYGQLCDLRSIKDDHDMLFVPLRVLFGLKDDDIKKLPFHKVLAFSVFVSNEVKRINDLFDSIKIKHDSNEIKAGIDDLDFGLFGEIDWYAQRMGFQNHDEVMDIPWVRLFKCKEIDNGIEGYSRRLRKILMKK
nr:MAG TPA: hypothetical protein [Caudoviricetes sp.]